MVLEDLLPLLQMSSGRRISVLKQMRELAVALGQPPLVSYIDRALAHDGMTRDYDNRWAEPTRRSLYAREVKEIGRCADICLSSIRDIVEAQIRGVPADNPVVMEARAMLEDIFPAGVRAITALPFIDEVAACEVVVAKLNGRWATTVTTMGLTQRLAFLADYTRKYREAVDQHRNLSFATVQHYRKRGQQFLREVVIIALALYPDSSDPAQVAIRERLLAPLMTQLADVRAHNRVRRGRLGADGGDGGLERGEASASDGEPEALIPQGDEAALSVA